MYLEKMPEQAGPRDVLRTTAVMQYELGSVTRALIRSAVKCAQGDLKSASAYLAEAKVELSDLMTQCYVLAEQEGWSRIELDNIGHERFCERMKELGEGRL